MSIKAYRYSDHYKLNSTLATIRQNVAFGHYSAWLKTMIIRGIGYRAFFLMNDLNEGSDVEFPFQKYLILRAGHTSDKYQGVPRGIYVKISKKDRKLVIFGSNIACVNNLSYFVFKYRMPSVYTGRGIRRKGLKFLRKAGKKDKQKGKGF